MQDITTRLEAALRKCEPYANAEFQETADFDAMEASDEAREALAALEEHRKGTERAPVGAHTAEPWAVGDCAPGSIWVGDTHVATCDWTIENEPDYRAPTPEIRQANARRVVACVNACAGIPTFALEGYSLATLRETLRDLVQQRVDNDSEGVAESIALAEMNVSILSGEG